MDTHKRDHILAIATPILVLASSFISPWLLFFLPVILYFTFKKLALDEAKIISLRMFDLNVSLAIFAVFFGLIGASIKIVGRDGGFSVPFISSGLFVTVISISLGCYWLFTCIMFSLRSYQKKEHKPKLSMGMFEALRGKRVSSV